MFEMEIKNKKRIVEDFLNSADGNFEINLETFDDMLKKFKLSGKRTYDFITKAGEEFQLIMFRLSQKMIQNENFPSDFKYTILNMIYKGTGKREILSNNRFIHCKEWFPRVVEGLIVNGGMKEQLVSNSSMYQIGGQPGHRPEELLFVLKSIIAKYRYQGKVIILNFFDVKKYFDKEMIEDAILTCIKRGVD